MAHALGEDAADKVKSGLSRSPRAGGVRQCARGRVSWNAVL